MDLKTINAIKTRFDCLPGTVLVSDADSKVLYANKSIEMRTGYAVGEAVGKKPGKLWGGNMENGFYQELWGAINSAGFFNGEVENINKNGSFYNDSLNIFAATGGIGAKYFVEVKAAGERKGWRLKERFDYSHDGIIFLYKILSGTQKCGEVENELLEKALGVFNSVYDFIHCVFVETTRLKYSNRESDAEMVFEAKKDPRNFDKLYKKYYKNIVRYFSLRLDGNRAESEEMAQEVFSRAFANIQSFNVVNASYLTYLFRIAHNLLVNHYRESRKTEILDLDSVLSDDYSAENRFLCGDDLKKALARLPDSQKMALEMMYFEGMSVREMACCLNKSENAVKLDLSRGRKKLHELLK